ncbi:MAG: hypothetical protein K2M36_05170, partial [Clostridia bacterium]|nr:hypothetical protein [Clostridia bacterium]
LIQCAFNALGKNEDFRSALMSTDGMQLDHTIGCNIQRKTILTKDEFICNLRRLRDELKKSDEIHS